MHKSKRTMIVVVVAATMALLTGLTAGAFGAEGDKHGASPHSGKGHGGKLIQESLAPSLPTDPMFHGVNPGTLPWALKSGDVRLTGNGRLDLQVKGPGHPRAWDGRSSEGDQRGDVLRG